MANGPFGLTIGLNPANGQPATNYPFWTNLFADMAALGLTWLRFQLNWQNIELTQGSYTWGALDDAVSHCNNAGINIEYTIRGAPAWALLNPAQQATTEPFYQMDPFLTAGFVQQVCNRYNGFAGFGLINALGFNEDFNSHHTPVNGGYFGLRTSPSTLYDGSAGVTSANAPEPSRDPYFFVQVLKAVSPVVRNSMPSGTPLGTGCIYWTYPIHTTGAQPRSTISNATAFVNGLYQYGGYGLFDFIDIHYYAGAVDPNVGSAQVNTWRQSLADINAAATAAGDNGRAIWVSEFGRNVPSDCTATVAASQLLSMYQQAVPLGVKKLFFFTLDYSTSSPSGDSLTLWNGSMYVPQPAYTSIQNFIGSNPNLQGKFAKYMVHA